MYTHVELLSSHTYAHICDLQTREPVLLDSISYPVLEMDHLHTVSSTAF
jgi:hypothetical protein